MADFACTLKFIDFPKEVKLGSMIRAVAEVSNCSETVRSVIASVDAYGLRRSFQRESDTRFTLALAIPRIVPRGNYKISVWAVGKSGARSAAQTFQVVVK